MTLGNGDVEVLLRRFDAGEQVGLVESDTVDRDVSLRVAAHDVVTTYADHPLDEVLAARGGDTERGPDVVQELRDRVARRMVGELSVLLPRRRTLEDLDLAAVHIADAV